jgi:hypothetical protein
LGDKQSSTGTDKRSLPKGREDQAQDGGKEEKPPHARSSRDQSHPTRRSWREERAPDLMEQKKIDEKKQDTDSNPGRRHPLPEQP